MNCIFIYNPNSGKGRIKKKFNYIKHALEEKYDPVVIYESSSPDDLIKTAKDACGKYDVVAFSGGDGTFNAIANAICGEEKRPILGYIPSGTVNDLGRNLKIPKNIKKAVQIITKGDIVYHDAGLINDTYFAYVVGIGTFTSVSYHTQQSIKKILGKMAYILDGLEDLIYPRIVNVKIKDLESGEMIEGEYPLVLVLNSKTCGGFNIDRDGHLNDGYFDIICVKKFYKFHSFNILNLFLFGARKKRKITSYYQMMRSKELTIETDDQTYWTIDGEKGMCGNVHITNLHNHFRILVPKRKNKPLSKQFLPEDDK